MSTAIADARYTPEDLLSMPDGVLFELVDGKVVERTMSWEASRVGARLVRYLQAYCDQTQAGEVAQSDASFQCFPDDPDKVRRADASFFRQDRVPQGEDCEGHCPISPDLAAEVISPNERLYQVEEKVQEYIQAGVRLVWVIVPLSRTVYVHRRDGTGAVLSDKDELSGEDVVPGFRCRVADLFSSSVRSQ